MNNEILLNVADIRHCSEVNGPGIRTVVWVQGCTRKCPGCINQHMQEHKEIKLFEPVFLGKILVQVKKAIGLTISGGEPFEQSLACALLAERFKQHGKSVMVFTGYPFEELQQSREPSVQRFLKSIDLIVAGPYIRELACESRMWRASSNQTVHYLNGSAATEEPDPQAATVEVKADGERMFLTGFPASEDLTWFDTLGRKLREIGV